MGRSSLLGTERAAKEAPGHDTAALGPGDSSDSGSDLAGIADSDIGDPTAPVDIAMRDDHPHSLMPSEAVYGGSSDASGTGERRSAGGDAGLREAADIGVDRIFIPGVDEDPLADELSDDEDADLKFVDEAQAGDPAEDEDEDTVELAEADAAEDALREGLGRARMGEDDAYDAAVKVDEDGTTDPEDDVEDDEAEEEEEGEGGLGDEDDGIPRSSSSAHRQRS